MNRLKKTLAGLAVSACLAAAATSLTPIVLAAAEPEMHMPQTAAEHAAEAARYEQEARELEAKAEHHAQMAKRYRARYSAGTKGAEGIRSLIRHCERLAKSYREAASEARAMAQTHRHMSEPA